MSERVPTHEVTLERMRIAVDHLVSRRVSEIGFAINPRFDMVEHMADMIVAKFEQDVFGEQVLHETVSYPAEWWQAFKERWFPEWLVRRYPVRYKRHKFDARYLYPSIQAPNRPEYRSILYTDMSATEFSQEYDD